MDISKYNREDLVHDLTEKKLLHEAEHAKAVDRAKDVMEGVIERTGLGLFGHLEIIDDLESIDFVVPGAASINMHYFRMDSTNPRNGTLSMNFCTFGSFSKNDEGKCRYATAIGMLASHLSELETALSDYPWEELDSVRKSRYEAEWMLSEYDREYNRKILEENIVRYDGLLAVDMKVVVGRKYDDEIGEYCDDVRTVLKLTDKTVTICGFPQRIKRNEVLKNLANGNWKIAVDTDSGI